MARREILTEKGSFGMQFGQVAKPISQRFKAAKMKNAQKKCAINFSAKHVIHLLLC